MGYVCWVGIVETCVQHYIMPHETYNIAVELSCLLWEGCVFVTFLDGLLPGLLCESE